MNYVFAREFQELTQGSAASPAFHGQATHLRGRFELAHYPIRTAVTLLEPPLVPTTCT